MNLQATARSSGGKKGTNATSPGIGFYPIRVYFCIAAFNHSVCVAFRSSSIHACSQVWFVSRGSFGTTTCGSCAQSGTFGSRRCVWNTDQTSASQEGAPWQSGPCCCCAVTYDTATCREDSHSIRQCCCRRCPSCRTAKTRTGLWGLFNKHLLLLFLFHTSIVYICTAGRCHQGQELQGYVF